MRNVIHTHFPAVDSAAFMDHCMACQKRMVREDLRAMPGAVEIVAFFRDRGVKLAVASSSPMEDIRGHLGRLGLLDSFDALVSGLEVARGKPYPDIFLLAAERIGLPPEDCYVFEDGINGCLAGIAAGCATIMIPDLFQPTEEVRRGCFGIYDSLLAAQAALASA